MASRKSSQPSRVAVGLAVGALIGLLAKDLDLTSLLSYWGDRTPLVVIGALVAAGLWKTRLQWLVTAAAVGLAVVWLGLAFTPVSRWLARDLVRADDLEAADAVFVLGSGIQMDGDLTGEAMSRLLRGLEILELGLAPRLILPELPPPIPSYRDAALKIMKNLGMSQEVLSVGPVRRTRDEAVLAASLCRERNWTRLILVTSPTHTRRASAAFEREGILVISSPCTETRFDLENLDQPDDRIAAFGNLIHERGGLWLYERRDWIRPSGKSRSQGGDPARPPARTQEAR